MKKLQTLGVLAVFAVLTLGLMLAAAVAADGPPPAEGKGKHKAEKVEARRAKRIAALEEKLRHLEERHTKQLAQYEADKARLTADLQTLRSGGDLPPHPREQRHGHGEGLQNQLKQLDEKLAKLQQRRDDLAAKLAERQDRKGPHSRHPEK